MGKYDAELARSREMLAKAEAEYHDAVLKMADAAPGVREFVLGNIRQRIDEANQMIEIFSSEG